ncbi:MAG TPA: Spy/CpxP family protein refolding chaperone [Polyangiaceae bacterium]|nr:Spy/CpxP family protein refolding chaperone [Polyangiaceae bacterium]
MKLSWLVGLVVACTACSGAAKRPPTEAPGASAASASEDDGMTDLVEHHRHHHHGGVLMFVVMGIDSLGVSPEQQDAITKIQADLSAKIEPTRVAERRLLAALADGVAAESLDRAKIDAAIEELGAASATIHGAAAEALDRLHAALTPPQRVALAGKVRANWEVWKVANTDDKAPDGGHVGALAKELNLSEGQVAKVRATLSASPSGASPALDLAQADAYVKQLEKAFASDSFEAKALDHADEVNRALDGWGAAHLARFCEAVMPVLTADQRARLADMLREHLSHGDEGRTDTE